MMSMRHFCGQHTLLLVVTHLSALEVAACLQHRLSEPRGECDLGEESAGVLVGLGVQRHSDGLFLIFLHTFQIPDFSSDL